MLTKRQLTQAATLLTLTPMLGGLMLFAPTANRAGAEVLPPLPHTVEGRSGGNSYTNDCGYVGDTANYTFHLSQATSDLSASVTSTAIGADMTLTIKGPDGRTCLDDTNASLMPSYDGPWPAGEYQVWVGDWGDSQPFSLTFSN
jgi:hypothetical protein